MGIINLYRIDPEKNELFIRNVATKLCMQNTILRERTIADQVREFGLTLYLSRPQQAKDVDWHWIFDEFNVEAVTCTPNPKSVILIETEETNYVVTFGYSYFFVDKYCDRNFGFDFARRIQLSEVKTTSLTSPHSRKNKTVNTYINYNELEFDSGESFAKIKGKISLPDDFELFKPTIEIGSSIKFAIESSSLDKIIDLILYVETILVSDTEYYKIPVFSKVSDNELLEELNAELMKSIRNNPMQINVSELDIIGVTEIFNNNDGDFIIQYRRHSKNVSQLTTETIHEFCNEFHLSLSECILDIKVVSLKNGETIKTESIRDIIDYTNDQRRCLLSKGKWYFYNDDYIGYLEDSIAEIDVINNPIYDFNNQIHDSFIDRKYDIEKDNPAYAELTEIEIKALLRKKYYAERAFNIMRAEQDGYINYDRTETRVGGAPVELMDLYHDRTMFTVKIGNSSSKLCHAINQSLSTLKLYKYRQVDNAPTIDSVALWLILERETRLSINERGMPDLSELEMLMLKNRIDQWKKEVRLVGYKPIIYLNYRS